MSHQPPNATAQPTAVAHHAGRGRIWTLALLAAIVLAGLWWFDPQRTNAYPRCMFHELTGLHCPGCGSTRAAHALVHGRLLEALRFNPLLVVGLPLVALAMVGSRWKWGRLAKLAISGRAVLVVLLVFAVVRNLPGPLASWLAPPEAATGTDGDPEE
jgi:hypothetical protein